MWVCRNCKRDLKTTTLRVDWRVVVVLHDNLCDANQAVAIVPEPPAADDGETSTTEQDYNDNRDDETLIALLGFSAGGNRRFNHNFISSIRIMGAIELDHAHG